MSSGNPPPHLNTDASTSTSPATQQPNGSIASPLFISKPQPSGTYDALQQDGGFSPVSYPKSKIKVLLLEKIHKLAIKEFEKEGYQLIIKDKLSEEELIEQIKDVHAIGIRSRTKLNANVLKVARKLLAVGCFCIGTDQTDLEVASKQGIVVFNSPYANTRSVAELVLCELIALARQLVDRSSELHYKQHWNKQSSHCYEVRGKVLGIVGYGHVGSQLSVIAESLGMKVIFYDIMPKLALGNAMAVDTLQELLQQSDFVSLHVPATPETRHMISSEQLKLMKQGSYLLNASRGHVVDVPAVVEALKSKHLSGGAFDVFPYEPAAANEKFQSELVGLPNVILTPHIGGSTEEAQAAIGLEVSRKTIFYINTGATLGAVNMPEMSLPQHPNSHRILNIHQNVPGVLRDINNVLADYNVVGQMLMTSGVIGYLIADIDKGASKEVKDRIASLKTNIKTRILY